jgi:hypothetical protein
MIVAAARLTTGKDGYVLANVQDMSFLFATLENHTDGA